MNMLSLLYFAGYVGLFVLSLWLILTLYLYLLHRKYAHIPSPRMNRYVYATVSAQ